MSKLIFISIVLVFLFSNASLAQNKNITAEEIWDNYLNTFKDLDKVKNLKTVCYSSQVKFKNGGHISNYKIIRPSKSYCETIFDNGFKRELVYNNGKGQIIFKGEVSEMPPIELWQSKRSALFLYEPYYKELGCEIKLMNDKIINGVAYYKLELTSEHETLYYILDKKSFEIAQLITNNGVLLKNEVKVIDGINLVTKFMIINSKDTVWAENSRYEFDVEVDESLFEIK